MSKAFVRIQGGSYKDVDMAGYTFQVNKFDPDGRFVAVYNQDQFEGFPAIFRIKLDDPTSYEFVSAPEGEVTKTVKPGKVVVQKSDDERMAEIAERFEILTDMTKAAINGDIRAMIVSGPPGVGKSFGVEREIEQVQLMAALGSKLRAEVVKGSTTALGLYSTLYKYSDPNCVLVFDDCDSVLLDDVSLNLLKGALDSGKKRKISWLADSSLLRREGIPDSFTFNGTVIFITNLKFDSLRSQKLKDHLEALQSRCHYLDLTLDTMHDKILRIKQIARDGALFADYDFDAVAQDEIVNFMEENQTRLREVSLRMAIKVAQLRKSFPARWKAMASTTCMKAD